MQSFRTLSYIEGVSLILLLFVAMPLKYFFAASGPVFYFGLAHGMLFVCYLISTLAVGHKQGWSVGYSLYVIALGVVPLGFIWLDRSFKSDASRPILQSS